MSVKNSEFEFKKTMETKPFTSYNEVAQFKKNKAKIHFNDWEFIPVGTEIWIHNYNKSLLYDNIVIIHNYDMIITGYSSLNDKTYDFPTYLIDEIWVNEWDYFESPRNSASCDNYVPRHKESRESFDHHDKNHNSKIELDIKSIKLLNNVLNNKMDILNLQIADLLILEEVYFKAKWYLRLAVITSVIYAVVVNFNVIEFLTVCYNNYHL
jgi:hypothetical protein